MQEAFEVYEAIRELSPNSKVARLGDDLFYEIGPRVRSKLEALRKIADNPEPEIPPYLSEPVDPETLLPDAFTLLRNTISHFTGNSLTGVRTYTEMLRDTIHPESRTGKSLASMVNGLRRCIAANQILSSITPDHQKATINENLVVGYDIEEDFQAGVKAFG